MIAEIEKALGDDFNGVVSIKTAGETIERTYGYRDIANEIPNNPQTRFGIASGSKAFTAVAILKLIDQGRLSLNSTLGETLPDIDLGRIDPNITVEQLLTHTSGVGDYFDEEVMDDYAELWHDIPNYRIRSSADYPPLLTDKPMAFEPGAEFAYNNSGYVLLGLIIEAITGEPFDKFINEVVFQPAGMADSGYFELDKLPRNCAIGYVFADADDHGDEDDHGDGTDDAVGRNDADDEEATDWHTNIYSIEAKGSGAGGGFTTASDMAKFWDALLGGQLLSTASLEKMLSPQHQDGIESYGTGVWLAALTDDETGEVRYEPWLQGSDPGVSFISSVDRNTGTTITVISNTSDDVWHAETFAFPVTEDDDEDSNDNDEQP